MPTSTQNTWIPFDFNLVIENVEGEIIHVQHIACLALGLGLAGSAEGSNEMKNDFFHHVS